MLFADLLSLHLVIFLMFFIVVYSWEGEGLVQLMQLGEGGAGSANGVGRGRGWFS